MPEMVAGKVRMKKRWDEHDRTNQPPACSMLYAHESQRLLHTSCVDLIFNMLKRPEPVSYKHEMATCSIPL